MVTATDRQERRRNGGVGPQVSVLAGFAPGIETSPGHTCIQQEEGNTRSGTLISPRVCSAHREAGQHPAGKETHMNPRFKAVVLFMLIVSGLMLATTWRTSARSEAEGSRDARW